MRKQRQSAAGIELVARPTRRTQQHMAITKALRHVALLFVLLHLAVTARSRVAPHTVVHTEGLKGDSP